MQRPLETTFWIRFKQFVKGVFLYNTIYWRRASDDLEIHHMSREERAGLRPKRDLEIIRPRERPRPVVAEAVLGLPAEGGERSDPLPEARVSASPARAISTDPEEDGNVEIHRRKKRRRGRHSKVMPKRYLESAEGGGGGIFGWLFRK